MIYFQAFKASPISLFWSSVSDSTITVGRFIFSNILIVRVRFFFLRTYFSNIPAYKILLDFISLKSNKKFYGKNFYLVTALDSTFLASLTSMINHFQITSTFACSTYIFGVLEYCSTKETFATLKVL